MVMRISGVCWGALKSRASQGRGAPASLPFLADDRRISASPEATGAEEFQVRFSEYAGFEEKPRGVMRPRIEAVALSSVIFAPLYEDFLLALAVKVNNGGLRESLTKSRPRIEEASVFVIPAALEGPPGSPPAFRPSALQGRAVAK
ncbi:hypothetical protein KM043_006530 [Ampulex compressa]|nr:hypothetical protein KM043_006530 [Ampulex compressa]